MKLERNTDVMKAKVIASILIRNNEKFYPSLILIYQHIVRRKMYTNQMIMNQSL